MPVILINSDEEFARLTSVPDVILVNFWAPWSDGSNQTNIVLEELVKDPDCKLQMLTVEAEKFPDICISFNIIAVPTVLFLQGGKMVDRVDGVHAAQLTQKAKLYGGALGVAMSIPMGTENGTSAGASVSTAAEDLTTRMKKIINASSCVAVIKGTKTQPRCGFSKQLVAILNETGVDYSTFDILSDEDIRQGLKEFSNWPTFPQLYAKGELVGGLDIVKEMNETGDLMDALPTTRKALEEKLKQLINRDTVMLFMKGNPDEPCCGFSKQLVRILNESKIKFGSFDILKDEEVRQELKKFSNWPTYPQLYAKGELIGGLDIVKELQLTNELTEALTG